MAAIPYLNTVVSPSGGSNAFTGTGQKYHFTLSEFGASASLTLTLTDNLTGLQTQIGAGDVTGIEPTFVFAFNNKVYALAAAAHFSALGAAAVWNDPNGAGNGFIPMKNYSGAPDILKAAAPYQGNLAFVFRRMVQIWVVDPDPANYLKKQELPNIGTVAKESVKAVGDMDIYLLADNGVRSVRVRDASDNAVIADVGTPIDAILQPLLAALTDAQKGAACGVIDPGSNRYWIYIPNADASAGSIYVFSYFPGSQIAAWGAYSPTYQVAVRAPAANYTASVVTYTGLTVGERYAWKPGAHEVSITCGTTVLTREGAFTATATTATVAGSAATASFTGALSITTDFVPTKLVAMGGQVFVRGGNHLFRYGGSTNTLYDNCGVVAVTPYLDCGAPAAQKTFKGLDAALEGRWELDVSTDYASEAFKAIYRHNQSSFQRGTIPIQRRATHLALKLIEESDAYARLSRAIVHFETNQSK